MTHPTSRREAALYLVELGLNDCQIGRATGIPYRTVQNWQTVSIPGRGEPRPDCPRCHDGPLDDSAYAYLLGLYLGDGWLQRGARVDILMIYCCDLYPGLIAECADAMAVVRGRGDPTFRSKDGCIFVAHHWKHWGCLFPQHGSGPKHLRPITLEPWQNEVVEHRPDRFLRGLVHSDGCRYVNEVTSRGKRYRYVNYGFTNRSKDIRDLFCWACHLVGVAWRQSGPYDVVVARRADVQALDLMVGPKY